MTTKKAKRDKSSSTKSYILVSPLSFDECLERLRDLEVQRLNTIITCDLDESTPFPTFEMRYGTKKYPIQNKYFWLRGSIRPLEGGTLMQVETNAKSITRPAVAIGFFMGSGVIVMALVDEGTRLFAEMGWMPLLCVLAYPFIMLPIILRFQQRINLHFLLSALKNATKSFEAVRKDEIEAV